MSVGPHRAAGTAHALTDGVHGRPFSSSDPLRVLIVEDDPSNRDIMRLVLEMAGHSVSTVGTGGEALEMVEQEHPDTVLLDLGLPDQNGRDVTAALRAGTGPVPRIVITSGTPFSEREAQALGADAVLQKPFGPDRLLSVLR